MGDKLINAGTWSGAVLASIGALTLSQWLAIFGAGLALAGFCVNFWHKVRLVKLREQELEIARQRLNG